MAASADIFSEREPWRRPLTWSALFHGGLLAGILIYGVVVPGSHPENWGGAQSGDAMSATLVSMPGAPVESQNIVASESKGLGQSLPKKAEEFEAEAVPIPERIPKKPEEKRRPQPSVAQKVQPPPPEDNRVPFGEGGPLSGSMVSFQSGATRGGMNFTGGSGDFGSRYAWYVDMVRRKVSENWLKYEVDPSINSANRVYLTFDIQRDGTPGNIQIEQSSGVPSLDISAKRALERIDRFTPLPSDYAGSKVSVEFWFDYRR